MKEEKIIESQQDTRDILPKEIIGWMHCYLQIRPNSKKEILIKADYLDNFFLAGFYYCKDHKEINTKIIDMITMITNRKEEGKTLSEEVYRERVNNGIMKMRSIYQTIYKNYFDAGILLPLKEKEEKGILD